MRNKKAGVHAACERDWMLRTCTDVSTRGMMKSIEL